MSTSSQHTTDLPAGPEELKTLSDEQFIEALKKYHVDNIHAPRIVKDILQRMYSLLKSSKEREAVKSKEASEKILSVYDHYSILEEMYKTEHNAVIKLTDEKAEMKAEFERLSSEAGQQLNEVKKQLETQREEANKQATKQALGRKRLEDILVAKNIEIDSIRKKLQEIEAQNAKLQTEIHANKTLMSYHIAAVQPNQHNADVQQPLLRQQNQRPQ
ncbi:uncharacterized protein ATC70_009929 [Mucor velutinosus]|uniref:Uncharacterized protein n=1 Tax=Mucor velutinosus TaxID=708070 RepID=A0AAN7DRN4_9FUNG|nr:hypothetical protein ATC70_009929 [Mucor velutinosus]